MSNREFAQIGSGAGFSANIKFRRLVTIGVILPVLLAVADRLILAQCTRLHSQPVVIACVMAFYVLQIGTISWVVGSYIDNAVVRWVMFGWIMILIDLQLAVITSDGAGGVGASCLATAIFSGQLGIFAVWGVLGKG